MSTARSKKQKSPPRDAARARLIDSGLRVFARYGFDGVSTRQLAEAARVNISAIKYYFGGKEGYYLAVAQHIVDHHAAGMRELVAGVHARLDQAGAAASKLAPGILEQLLTGITQVIVPHKEGPRLSSFILREQLQPSAAFDILFEGMMRHVHEAMSRLVGLMIDRPADDPETILRAHAIMGQILIFQNGRAVAFRRLGWDRYTEERVAKIAEIARGMALGGLRGKSE